jgi:hypothetical protein
MRPARQSQTTKHLWPTAHAAHAHHRSEKIGGHGAWQKPELQWALAHWLFAVHD